MHWNATHGASKTRLYRIWTGLKHRKYSTYNPTVCKQWAEFEPFRDWALSNGYDDNLTIDRINNQSNYQPDNCRWITREENAYRARKRLTVEQERQMVEEWRRSDSTQRELAKKHNVSRNTIQRAFKNFKNTQYARQITKDSGRIARS